MTLPLMSPATESTPHATHPLYRHMEPAWRRCRDLDGGTDAVREAGQLYLPKHEAETQQDYEVRRRLGVLYNAFSRTIAAMVGLITARDVQLEEDNPLALLEHWENLDGRRTHGAVFARRWLRDAIVCGHAGVLVDAPRVTTDGRALSRADERALGVRPYWRRYRAEDIRDWVITEDQGERILQRLTLRETFFERRDRFRAEQVTDYRVLEWNGPGDITAERWRLSAGVGANAQPRVVLVDGPTPIVGPRRIPFALLATGESDHDDPYCTRPPLLDLADLNLAHYRADTERRNLLRLGCLPVPVRKGYVGGQNEVVKPFGPNVLMDVPTDGDFYWAEITGSAFAPTADDLKQLERRMAALGLAFLESDTRVAETAEAKRIDAQAQQASLSSIARAAQDAIETAIGFHAEYLRAEGGSAQVNMDFERTVLDPAMITALTTLRASGSLSLETLLTLLQRGRVLADEFDVDAEVARIMAEGLATSGGSLPDVAVAEG